MPSAIQIPARTERRCEPCKHHNLTAYRHVRSGEGSYRKYECTHADAWESMDGEYPTEAAKERAKEIQALLKRDGRFIGRTEKQPDWCPLNRGNAIGLMKSR